MMGRLTPTVKNLLLINVILYFLPSILGLSGINRIMGLYYWDSPYFYPFQFFTYMFSHGGLGHIFFNMLGLFFLGPLLEQFWGGKRFLTFYLATGIGAGFIYLMINFFQLNPIKTAAEDYALNPNPDDFYTLIAKYDKYDFDYSNQVYEAYYDNPTNSSLERQTIEIAESFYNRNLGIPMVGASGAIYGILMAFGLLFPNTELMLLFPPIPIKAKYLVLILGGMAIFSGFRDSAGDNTAHFAHLGGMIVSYILIKFWQKNSKNFF